MLCTVAASVAFAILPSLRFLYRVNGVDERESLGTIVHTVWERSEAFGTAPAEDGWRPSTSTRKSTTQNNLVVAYSLWGSDARYSTGMINVCRTHARLYPHTWKIWIYHDNTVPSNIINEMDEMEHVRLINVETEMPAWVKGNLNPMTWRFLVASDPTVQAYAVRDSDSIPSKRESSAIEEFLESGKAFHVIRDHPMHNPTHFAPILGGMWGGLHRAVPHMDELLQQKYPAPWREAGRAYANDQDFLWQEIMPIAYNNCLQHDSYYCRESNAIAFPLSRKEANETYLYVGNTRAPTMEVEVDSRLDTIDNVRKYEDCLKDRKLLEEKMKSEGIPSFAAAVNTTFNGQIRGLSTEAWGKWKETFNLDRPAKPRITIKKSSLKLGPKKKTLVQKINRVN